MWYREWRWDSCMVSSVDGFDCISSLYINRTQGMSDDLSEWLVDHTLTQTPFVIRSGSFFCYHNTLCAHCASPDTSHMGRYNMSCRIFPVGLSRTRAYLVLVGP